MVVSFGLAARRVMTELGKHKGIFGAFHPHGSVLLRGPMDGHRAALVKRRKRPCQPTTWGE